MTSLLSTIQCLGTDMLGCSLARTADTRFAGSWLVSGSAEPINLQPTNAKPEHMEGGTT